MDARPGSWKRFGIFWILAVGYFSSMDLLAYPALRHTWPRTLLMNALQVSVWMPLLLPAFAFLARWPLGGLATWRRWMGFLALVLAAALLSLVTAFLLARAFAPPSPWGPVPIWDRKGFEVFFRGYLHYYLLNFFAIFCVHHMFLWQQRFRDRELLASHLESRLFQAQNQALRMQLQPHFLFNTLHSISALMHSDVKAADRMLVRLADLLRLSLDRSGEQEVSLAQELAFLEAYLQIEHVRFQDRLQVGMEVPEALHDAALPTFILQPLVENAIRHGFARRAQGGRVAIRARDEEGRLLLEVEDDGAGAPKDYREGVGLRSVRERLQLLYGARASFALLGRPGRGTLASLALPLRRLGSGTQRLVEQAT